MSKRNTSLDIYRLLCMFLITTVHYFCYSSLAADISPTHVNYIFAVILRVLGTACVYGFVLISAYFLIDATTTLKKTVSFIMQVEFFSIIIFLLTLPAVTFTPAILLKSCLPFLTKHYWYPISYVFLLLLVPSLNKVVRAFARESLLQFIITLSVILSVIIPLSPVMKTADYLGSPATGLLWFVLLYLIAAYIKLYGIKHPRILGVLTFLVSGTILVLLQLFEKFLLVPISSRFAIVGIVYEKIELSSGNGVLVLGLAVSSFIMFVHSKMAAPAWLGKCFKVAIPAVFVIYLIQEHNAVREALWNYVNIAKWANSFWLIPVMIAVFLGLWLIAIILTLLYRLCRKIFMDKIEEKICTVLTSIGKKWNVQ